MQALNAWQSPNILAHKWGGGGGPPWGEFNGIGTKLGQVAPKIAILASFGCSWAPLGRMKFEVRLLQHATKNQQKSMENRMFCETSIPLNSPQGGPPPPPHLCARMLGDCRAFKACICRTASPKAHGEMKAHILATICLHVVGKQGGSHEFRTDPTNPNLLVRNAF